MRCGPLWFAQNHIEAALFDSTLWPLGSGTLVKTSDLTRVVMMDNSRNSAPLMLNDERSGFSELVAIETDCHSR